MPAMVNVYTVENLWFCLGKKKHGTSKIRFINSREKQYPISFLFAIPGLTSHTEGIRAQQFCNHIQAISVVCLKANVH